MSAELNVGSLVAYIRLDTSDLDRAPQVVSRAMTAAGTRGSQAATQAGTSMGAALTGALVQASGRLTQQGVQAGSRYGAGITRGITGALNTAPTTAGVAGTRTGNAMGAAIRTGIVGSVQQGLHQAGADARHTGAQLGSNLGGGIAPAVRNSIQSGLRGAAPDATREGHRAGGSFGEGFGSSFKDVAGKAFAAVGIGAVLSKAMDAQSSSARLTAQLHLPTDEVTKFGAIARKVYGDNFAEDLGQANEVIKSVVLNIGGMRTASASTMTAISEQVSAVASTFGADFDDVTKAVGQMMKTGLAPDAQSALDVITAGFQANDDKAGDFLDTLNEYSVQFQKLGLDGKTSVGLISQALQGGARDSDVAANGLKEFAIRVSTVSTTTTQGFQALGLSASDMYSQFGKGGPAAETALETVLNRVKTMQDPVARATVATDLFGTSWEDLGSSLMAFDPKTAAAGLGDLAGRAGDVAASGNTAAGGIASFMHGLQNTATAVGDQVLPQMTPLIGTLGSVATVAGDAVGVFAHLPGPLKDAGLALGGLVLLRGPLTTMFGAVETQALRASTALAASSGIAGAAGTAVGGLGRMAGILGGPWGLAIGAGVTALVSWATSSTDATTKTRDFSSAIDAQTGKLTANAAVDIATQVKDSIDAYKAAGGAAGDYTSAVEGNTVAQQKVLATFTATEQKAISGTVGFTKYGRAFAELGITANDVATAYASGDDAVGALQEKFRAGTGVLNKYGIGMQDVNNIFAQAASVTSDTRAQVDQYHKDVDGLADAQKSATTIANDAAAATERSRVANQKAAASAAAAAAVMRGSEDRYVEGLQAAGLAQTELAGKQDAAALSAAGMAKGQDDAKASAVALTQASNDLATGNVSISAGLKDLYISQHSWNGLMDNSKKVIDQADASLQLFSFAVDQLSGRNRTSEEATKNLNDQVRAIAAAFKDGTDATNGNIESLITASGAIDTTTEAGSKLYDSLNNYRTAADQSTDAAYESAVAAGNQAGALGLAQKAADDARAKFLAQAEALGINKTAAVKMADQLGILEGKKLTDKDFDINAKDKASKPIADIDRKKIAGKSFDVKAEDKASKVISDLETKIQGLQNKTVTLTVAQQNEMGQAQIDLNQAVDAARNRATGGLVFGPGTGTSDSIRVNLSNGEGVNTARAMSHAENVRAMHFMNAGGVIPGFKDGGLVGKGVNVDISSTGDAGGEAVKNITAMWNNVSKQAAAINAKAAAAAAAASQAASGLLGSQDPSSFGWQVGKGIEPFSFHGIDFPSGVAAGTASIWSSFLTQLVPMIPGGIRPGEDWGYENRDNVNSPGRKSFHAYGLALDVNSSENPNNGIPGPAGNGKYQIPQSADALAKRYNMLWGGEWGDAMHFELHESPSQVAGGNAGASVGSAVLSAVGGLLGAGQHIAGVDAAVQADVPLMEKVFQAKGFPLSQVYVMANQEQHESSGNPQAVNRTDINAQQGHPSVGILQFIPSTFQRYADSGYDKNIYDKESQMRAFLNYVPAQYGSLAQFAERNYGAYAKGDLVRGPGSGTSDSIVARVSNGEGINTAQAMSHPENVGAMRYMNAGGVIPGFAAGGLVSAFSLAGNSTPNYGDRRTAVNAGVQGMADALVDEWAKVEDKRRAATDAYDAQQQAWQNRVQATTAQEKRAADAAVKAATVARKNAEAQYTAERRNAAAASNTQKRLASVYFNLKTAASSFDSLSARLDTARDTLSTSRQDKAQAVSGYASSIAGFDGGLLGHSDTRNTSRLIVGGLRYDLGKVKSFYSDLSTLRKRGASAQILNELTGAFGQGGEITAHALATGPLADLRTAAVLEGQLQSVAGQAGSIAPSVQYDPLIRQQTANVATLAKAVGESNKRVEQYAARIPVEVGKALSTWTVQMDGAGMLKLIHPHVQAAVNKAKGQR